MEKLNATLAALADLIEYLNSTRNLYLRLIELNLDYTDKITPLAAQKEKLIKKLLIEYYRLSKKEYFLKETVDNSISTFDNIGILEECNKREDILIRQYAESINKDLLWEVLPILAQHLYSLRSSKTLLLNYLEHYREINTSINIDYSNHPVLIN